MNYYRLLEYSISKIIAHYGTSEECGIITIVLSSLRGVGGGMQMLKMIAI